MKPHLGRLPANLLGLFFWLAGACSLSAQELTLEEYLERHPPDAEGYVHVEGDILIPLQALRIGHRPKAAIATSFLECGCGFWDGGDVPYEFDDNVSEENRQRMRDAMAEWEAVANLNFRRKDWSDAIYTHIESSSEVNESTIGRIDIPFVNRIKITNWDVHFKIVHELGHCLGLWHEQSRSDRDTYVQINTDNIEKGQEDNFEKHDRSSHYGPYDFDSVMHYEPCAFSKDHSCDCSNAATRTITVLPPWDTQWQCKIGQRAHLSHLDALTMSFVYPQANWRFVDAGYDGEEQGTFFKPYRAVASGTESVPSGGTVWIQPGSYVAAGDYTKAMTLQAPLGGVTLH